MALRRAVLDHVRVPVQTLALTGSKQRWSVLGSLRFMSSHDDHLTKEEVIDRVLSVVKCFPKVDPSQVKSHLPPPPPPFLLFFIFHFFSINWLFDLLGNSNL